MTPLRHIMILASAGSGKTYALTNRFVDLLRRGVPPERIVALTFTRKAAGEFTDEILQKLATAAADPRAAERLARELEAPELGAADFRRLLRRVVDALPRLRLGTLDGFFARIARVFPFELGLAGSFELLEEHAARIERQRVLRQMFTRVGELDAAQQEFIEAFKRATFGLEEKQLGPRLDEFIDAHHERYLAAPDAACWGQAAVIWPDGCAWLQDDGDRPAAIADLAAWVEASRPGEKQREYWQAFLEAVAIWRPGGRLPRSLTYVIEKALAAWSDLEAGRAVLEFYRKPQALDARAGAALAILTRYVIGGEFRRVLAGTRGLHAVLRAYDQVYHDTVRRAGRLTFGDVQRLLLPDGDRASFLPRTEGARELIDYRLDGKIDHWLLDEFQDTSHGQWSVLRNLIDEVVQDTSGERSFFCVGDVKQAIYTWRDGDPRLFREIFQHYNSGAPGSVIEQRLVDSWRSGPPVIELVNRVFGDAAALTGLFPGEASRTWNEEWRDHVSAVPQRGGQCAVLLAEDESERWTRVVEILREVRPLERGLTCAVLVPTNAVATGLADFLRGTGGLPAVADSDLHVCTDQPVGPALLALLQAAAHPGDTQAWEHVRMTPLGAVLAAEGIATRDDAATRVLAQVHAHGFEAALEFWLGRLERALGGWDEFNCTRARQLAAAAARFDEGGGRQIDEFVAFMERHVVREPEGAGVVRVMTVHKSKGLGFDVVLLPDLQGQSLDQRRDGLLVQEAPDRSVAWVLNPPPKLCCEADPVLARNQKSAEAENCYEALSLLYVALTRAKRALYVIVEPVGKSTSRNYPRLLGNTLGDEARPVAIGSLERLGTWSAGDPQWYASLVAPPAPTVEVPVLAPWEQSGAPRGLRREARRPTGERDRTVAAGPLFALERSGGVDFGAGVHALLAGVEWAGAEDPFPSGRRDYPAAVVAEARAAVMAPELADVWRAPPLGVVWRERAFEIVLDDAWVSGVFDRVVVEREAGGRAQRVRVYDFKTDRVGDAAALAAAVERHAGQLNLYRRVAAVLAEVPLAEVSCTLVFTQIRRGVAVPAPVNSPVNSTLQRDGAAAP